MSNSDQTRYEALAHAIALIIWARSVDTGRGRPAFEHLNENGFDVPADVLARLGLMDVQDEGTHIFRAGWQPGAPLLLHRHAAEPTVFDLIITLMFLLHWDRSKAPPQSAIPVTMPPLPDMTDDKRFMGNAQIRFHHYAIGVSISALRPFGLCYRDETGALIISSVPELWDPLDLLDVYYRTRAEISGKS